MITEINLADADVHVPIWLEVLPSIATALTAILGLIGALYVNARGKTPQKRIEELNHLRSLGAEDEANVVKDAEWKINESKIMVQNTARYHGRVVWFWVILLASSAIIFIIFGIILDQGSKPQGAMHKFFIGLLTVEMTVGSAFLASLLIVSEAHHNMILRRAYLDNPTVFLEFLSGVRDWDELSQRYGKASISWKNTKKPVKFEESPSKKNIAIMTFSMLLVLAGLIFAIYAVAFEFPLAQPEFFAVGAIVAFSGIMILYLKLQEITDSSGLYDLFRG